MPKPVGGGGEDLDVLPWVKKAALDLETGVFREPTVHYARVLRGSVLEIERLREEVKTLRTHLATTVPTLPASPELLALSGRLASLEQRFERLYSRVYHGNP